MQWELLSETTILRSVNPELKILTYSFILHQFGVQLRAEWMPREFNQEAYELSRQIHIDDYLAALDMLWGPHAADTFPSFRTCQLPRFCSRYLNPFTEQVNAFTTNWSEEANGYSPPFTLSQNLLYPTLSVQWSQHREKQQEGTTFFASQPWANPNIGTYR